MFYKILSLIVVFVFVGSIAFSFYFSQLIVKYNASFQINQSLQNQLYLQHQSLLSSFLSLSEVKPTDFPLLQPITKFKNYSP